ncbi:MarR family winged helix-turn-helix transcriptional regulator [Oryzobacter terrae]|uniref:MarR family winged helix-turn-helix transcriptional regulator n=1 Tax=Oryzobacter terrae TaxID=1620385 RepID=UPI00366C3F17
MDDSTPLARLLAMSFRLMIDDLHARLRERGWDDVRPAYGFVLLALRDGSLRAKDVATLMGTTKQAASQLVAAMEAAGYVTRVASARDGRARDLALAGRGRELLAAVEEVYAQIEDEWARRAGADALATARRALSAVVISGDDSVPPAVRPVW